MASEEKSKKKDKDKEPEAKAKGKPAAEDAAGDGAAKPKRKLPIMTLAIVAGVMLMEGGTVAVVMMMNRHPATASAMPSPPPHVDAEKSKPSDDVEELLVDGKAANTKRGATFFYRYQIHAVVAKSDVSDVQAVLEKRRATIEDAVRQVIGRLEPKELDEEPTLTTLKRVLSEELAQIFGAGKVKQLLIPRLDRSRAD